MPYSYREDIATADAAFEASGSTLEETFTAAAEATLHVMVEDLESVRPEQEVVLDLENAELDLLLFDFLNELVFYKDARRLLLRVQSVAIKTLPSLYSLHAIMRGEEIDFSRHQPTADVKAVTLHRLKVEKAAGGWDAMVVLDI